MTDCDTLRASSELRTLKSSGLLIGKGKGKATYYVPGEELSTQPQDLSAQPRDLSTPPRDLSTPPRDLSTPPQEILDRIATLNKREHNTEKVEKIILDLCAVRPMKAAEIARYFSMNERYIKRKYLSKMIADKQLSHVHPEMINHPEQAYKASKQNQQ